MIIENKYYIGDFVYCKTDPQQRRMQVTSIIVYKNSLLYTCSIMDNNVEYSDFELTTEPDILYKID